MKYSLMVISFTLLCKMALSGCDENQKKPRTYSIETTLKELSKKLNDEAQLLIQIEGIEEQLDKGTPSPLLSEKLQKLSRAELQSELDNINESVDCIEADIKTEQEGLLENIQRQGILTNDDIAKITTLLDQFSYERDIQIMMMKRNSQSLYLQKVANTETKLKIKLQISDLDQLIEEGIETVANASAELVKLGMTKV